MHIVRPNHVAEVKDAGPSDAGVANITGPEIRDLALKFANLAQDSVAPGRPGGVLLVLLALLRAAGTVAVQHGFPRTPLFRVLATEIELAEGQQARLAVAATTPDGEAS